MLIVRLADPPRVYVVADDLEQEQHAARYAAVVEWLLATLMPESS